MVSESALRIIKEGRAKLRVQRSGMWQQQIFIVKRVQSGKDLFVELFLNKIVDMNELVRIANETGLPVEAENGRAFPKGTGAENFLNL
jgi:hypothetical protein